MESQTVRGCNVEIGYGLTDANFEQAEAVSSDF